MPPLAFMVLLSAFVLLLPFLSFIVGIRTRGGNSRFGCWFWALHRRSASGEKCFPSHRMTRPVLSCSKNQQQSIQLSTCCLQRTPIPTSCVSGTHSTAPSCRVTVRTTELSPPEELCDGCDSGVTASQPPRAAGSPRVPSSRPGAMTVRSSSAPQHCMVPTGGAERSLGPSSS